MDTFDERRKNKVIEALVDSIDNGEHNDVDIIVEDGVIRASKLVLSSSLEYFQKMFSKKSQFLEQKKNTVKFSCKKVVMKKILEHLYGGKLNFSGLSCVEIIELEDMLRFLLLQDAQKEVQKFLRSQLKNHKVPIPDCLNALDVALSLNLPVSTDYLVYYFSRRLDILVVAHLEVVENMSNFVFKTVMRAIVNREKKYGIKSPEAQLEKLKFVNHWFAMNNFSFEGKKKFFKFMQECFDLTKFKVNQLLGEVKKSNLFSDKEIYEAVNKLHKNLKDENRRRKQETNKLNKIINDILKQ